MNTEDKNFLAGMILGVVLTGLCSWIMFTGTKTVQTTEFDSNTNVMVDVRGSRWGIIVGREDDMLDTIGMYGMTDCRKKMIYVRSNLNKENKRDTVLHELLHAGTCDEAGDVHNDFYNSPTSADHQGIYKIANYMSELLGTNPELTKFLGGR